MTLASSESLHRVLRSSIRVPALVKSMEFPEVLIECFVKFNDLDLTSRVPKEKDHGNQDQSSFRDALASARVPPVPSLHDVASFVYAPGRLVGVQDSPRVLIEFLGESRC